MTTALGIAGVTAILRDLLNEGIINHNVSGVLGTTVSVSVLPPDRVVPANGTETSQLNLFLYQVTPQPGLAQRGTAVSRRGGATPDQRAAGAQPALPALRLQRRRPERANSCSATPCSGCTKRRC